MALIELNRNPSPRDVRQFGAIWFPALFAVVGLVVLHTTGSLRPAVAIWVAAAFVSVVGLVFPRVMRAIFVGWMVAAFPIGWTISHLMLAAIYYLVMTPIGLALRISGRDALDRRLEKSAESYWVRRAPAQDVERYFSQF